MDHLPFPKDPALPPVVIPYICEGAEPYDNRGFPTFPIRQGWISVAHESKWCRCPPDVAAIRAQTWLYFGLLHEFFGDDYERGMFVQNDMVLVQPVITTQMLPTLLERWFDRTSQRRKRSNPKIRDLLLEAERYSQPLDSLVPSAKDISLSIKILICSLGAAAGFVDSGIRRDETFNASPSRLLDERMLENNWCPYWVRIYSARYSVPTVNYVSALTRAITEDHRACTTKQCVAHNVNLHHYQTKHVTESCQCHFVGPSISQIGRSIQEGIVPLVCCTEASDGRILLDVIEADPGVEYTAISHVWSGGLGNPNSNSLPECQLRRLTQRMQNISRVESEWFWFRMIERAFKYMKVPFERRLKSILLSSGIRTSSMSRAVFWLDTLCVPTGLEHVALRRKAIDQMASIYAGADRVLVLDPELQHINIENMPNEQVCAYLACCAWRSRCWPYQEGRLARDRIYLLADNMYHHSVGLRQIVGVNRDINKHLIMRKDKDVVHSAVASFWEDMDSARISADKKKYSSEFTETWNGVSLRSTTKSEDLHGILAVLLGLSSREVLSLPLQERTKAVFQAQDSLPLALLFLRSGPKICDDIKNQWIPQYPSGHLTLQYGTMSPSADGAVLAFSLSASHSCGFLVNSGIPFHQHFCLLDDTPLEKVWIQLTGDHDRELEKLYQNSPVCYVLYNHLARHQLVSSSRDFVGARFYVSQYDEVGTVRLVYDCPLNYYYQHPFDTSEDSLGFDYSEVQGQRLSPGINYELDCGLASWYKPLYRRPKPSRLDVWRNLYTAPAMIYVMIVWCPCIVGWSLGVFGKGVGFYSTAVPALCTAFVRANIGRYLELPLLIETYQRLERKGWSASLDARKDINSVKPPFSPDKGPLYQYRPQWIAGVITLTGCLLLVLGFPWHQYSARILGAILIIETVPRVLVELLWRRTRVGEFGRRFINTWLHRVYWEADNTHYELGSERELA